MPSHNGDESSRWPGLELSAALATGTTWAQGAELVTRLWTTTGAVASILMSPSGADELSFVACRINSTGLPLSSQTTVEAPFAVLLDQNAIIDLVSESGLIGGPEVEVMIWQDLAASLVIQWPDSLLPASPDQRATLTAISRSLLGKSRDRPVQTPDASLLSAMAEYAAGAGHEINNPLASILGQSQLLLKSEQRPDTRQTLETIATQALRIRDMIGNSMLFARPPAPEMVPLNLVELAQQSLVPLNLVASDSDIEIRLASTSDVIEVTADRTQIGTLISQLVRNAIESLRSSQSAGEICVTLHDDQPGTVEICVSDNGLGLRSETERRNLFNPFFSGRSAGRGLGFGLCLVWQIVRSHGGMFLHYTPEGGGAAFHVALPTRYSESEQT